MKYIALSLVMLLVSVTVQAREIIVFVNGIDTKISSALIQHEIKESDKANGSQQSALSCSFLYYGYLAKGDIQGAAKLSTDPAHDAEKWLKYRERLGEKDFLKMMADYFTIGNVVLAEVVLDEETMLVVKTGDGFVAQFYRKKDGAYLTIDKPVAFKAFGKVLNMIREGKVEL